MKKTTSVLLIVLLLATAAGVRLFQLQADIPLSISPCADEGIYIHNARNKAIFGTWVLDEWNNMYISPIFNYFVYVSFSLVGVGFAQARLVSVAASLVTLWLVYASLKESEGAAAALLAALLLALNDLYVAFSKMAIMEPTMIMFMAMAMYFFVRGVERRGFLLLCGASCSLAFITKNLAGFYFVVPVAAILAGGRGGKRGALLLVLSGQLLVVAWWFFAWYLPHRGFIGLHNRIKIAERAPASLSQAASNVLVMFRSPFFGMLPFLCAAALVGFLIVAWALVRRRGVAPSALYALLWLCANFGYLSVFSWRPLRYSLTLLVPMVVLAVFPLSRAFRHGEELGGDSTVRRAAALRGSVGMCASLLIAASLLWSACGLARAWLHPRSMWPALAREIRERVPPDAVVSGGPAMSASMGIRNRLVWIHQLADYSGGDPFSVYGIDYLVVDGRELEFYARVFPDVLPRLLERSRLVYRMPLDDRDDALFIELPAR